MEMTRAMYLTMQNGGFTSGGFNFDAKLRRQSTDLEDYFYAHISGIDTLARSLLAAEKLIQAEQLSSFTQKRYSGWQTEFGQKILAGEMDFEKIARFILDDDVEPKPMSGHQELLERILADSI